MARSTLRTGEMLERIFVNTTTSRLETLDSLDRLTELDQHDDLKNKLLFSVIVVSEPKML